jgi:transposase
MKETIIEERQHHPRAFKHSVIKEYLAGGIGMNALLKKYNIKTHGGVLRWMRQLGYSEVPVKGRYLASAKPLSLPAKKTHKDQPSDVLSQQRIKELERLLEDEQLRSEAYRRVIEIAEKDFNIPIRKKPDTK